MYILDALWRGEIIPWERCIKSSSHYRSLAGQADTVYKKIWNELSDEGKQHFEELQKIQSEMDALNDEEVFIAAFRMGAQMILDVLDISQQKRQTPPI